MLEVRRGLQSTPHHTEMLTLQQLPLPYSQDIDMPMQVQVRQRFEARGGVVLEYAGAAGVTVHPNGVALAVPDSRGTPQPPPAERSKSAESATSSSAGPEAGRGAGGSAGGPGGGAAGMAARRGSRAAEQAGEADVGAAPSNGAGLGFRVQHGTVTARLLVDSTGNFGPMVRQARWGARPDGVCLVVGACCRGFPDNATGARRLPVCLLFGVEWASCCPLG